MSEDAEQINFFDMLGDPQTPLIPFEEQKQGVTGWIIEISGILLKKNGFKEDAVCVCTVPVVFEEDTTKDKLGRLSQWARSTHGNPMGWCGGYRDVYTARPSWEECVKYARKKYAIPQLVKYYERTRADESIWNYEDGFKGGKK